MANDIRTYKFTSIVEATRAKTFISQMVTELLITQRDNNLELTGDESKVLTASDMAAKSGGMTAEQIQQRIALIKQDIPKYQAKLPTLQQQLRGLDLNSQAIEIATTKTAIGLANGAIKDLTNEIAELQKR